MDIGIVSREIIKPSSPVHLLNPFKISLLDQLTPTTFSPLILFYSSDETNSKHEEISTRLKTSLSKTLTHFYPLSGRLSDNLFAHDYDEGVPYIETRVNTCLSDYLHNLQTGTLNHFLPRQPFSNETDPQGPQVAVQLNTFDCGGIAIGVCFSHKINDGATTSAFLKSWAANARGSYDKLVSDNVMHEGPSLFPPRKLLPRRYVSIMEKAWFKEGKYRTARFVFDTKAMASLRAKARGKLVENPTRIEALSAFIWKSVMEASQSRNPSAMNQAVNIRRLTKPRMSDFSIGNLFLWTTACHARDQEEDMKLEDLVAKMRKAIERINSDFLVNMYGDKRFPAICEYLNHVEEISSATEMFNFSSWLKFGFSEIDFGWGNPIWSGVMGGVGPAFRNSIIFKDMKIGRNNGVEAWLTLDEKVMNVLEKDPQFLVFASPNPRINEKIHLPY